MSAAFQVASLVNPPSFPNSIVWSEDNLIAVATGDIITILSPEQPHAPRGVITVIVGKPFSIGVIDRADLVSGCLLPTCLSRDRQPCVRSLSWSPVGIAPNSGCLLAVCSTEGRVKIYRQPYCEYQAEWIELMDISDLLHGYLAKINYGEPEVSSLAVLDDSATQTRGEMTAAANKDFPSKRESKRKRVEDFNIRMSSVAENIGAADARSLSITNVAHAVAETVVFPNSTMQEGSLVEVFDEDGGQHIWLPGKLKCIEGSKALIQFSETDADRDPQWFDMKSRTATSNETNYSGVDRADEGCTPRIRPSMNVAHLPEQISFVKHNNIGEILKAGQLVEAWTTDRWLEGVFLGFSGCSLLVKFSGDAASVALNPSDVRLAPLWVPEEKSWRVTVIRVLTQELPEVIVNKSEKVKENASSQMNTAAKARTNRSRKLPNNCSQNRITAHQYASRNSMVSSAVIAWSPLLKFAAIDADNLCDFYSLLAIGAKSGDISIWRIHRPPSYSIEQQDKPIAMILGGVLKSHNAWVTALSWGLMASDSNPRILLASGSSDGSVKIWLACGDDLEKSSEANQISFSLFSEVTAGNNVIVSALSLSVPVQSPNRFLLAIGRGSGSFEVWTCNVKTKSSKKVGSHDAHIQVIAGLAWAFDGRCLYTCSLDNSLHGWIYRKGCLSEVSIPPNNLGTRSFSDLPSVSDACYGLAISPGNLSLAVVRRFDAQQLDHMYQKRTQRAAVEFFWIGGQKMNISSISNLDFGIKACSGFSKDELERWGSILLWSLSQFECHDKHLVIWDIIAASLALKQCDPEFIEHIFLSWLQHLFKGHVDSATEDILTDALKCVSNITSRSLHLLNIFIRRVMISSGSKDSKACGKPANLGESCNPEEERRWMDLMLKSEEELRERLVGISLSTISSRISHPSPEDKSGLWNPTGIALMLKWVTQNHVQVHCQLNSVASEVKALASRPHTLDEYKDKEEQCSYCSAVVPFESPETAFCQGVKYADEEAPQKHELARCSVSMQVCPLTPLWFCMCCQRRASKLPPHQLFTMPNYPEDWMSFVKPVINNVLPKPLCPFCGISLQRLQPDFLLSISPV